MTPATTSKIFGRTMEAILCSISIWLLFTSPIVFATIGVVAVAVCVLADMAKR